MTHWSVDESAVTGPGLPRPVASAAGTAAAPPAAAAARNRSDFRVGPRPFPPTSDRGVLLTLRLSQQQSTRWPCFLSVMSGVSSTMVSFVFVWGFVFSVSVRWFIHYFLWFVFVTRLPLVSKKMYLLSSDRCPIELKKYPRFYDEDTLAA